MGGVSHENIRAVHWNVPFDPQRVVWYFNEHDAEEQECKLRGILCVYQIITHTNLRDHLFCLLNLGLLCLVCHTCFTINSSRVNANFCVWYA